MLNRIVSTFQRIGEGIKEKLLAECKLHTIVRLPKGVFNANTGIKTNLLFFTKGEPTKKWPKSSASLAIDRGRLEGEPTTGSPKIMNPVHKYEPPSKLAEELLLSPTFTPFGVGYLDAETIVGDVTASVEDIEAVLRGFEAEGFVVGQVVNGIAGRAYAPQRKGWEAREHLLREKSLRHPALIHPKDYALSDLLIALVVAPHIWNSRLTGGFLASDTKVTKGELEVYLYDFAPEELRDGCSALVSQEMLTRTTKYGSTEEAFEVTGRGRQAYKSAVSERLHLADDQSILDVAARTCIEVFDAWQSECKPSRNLIESVLPAVVEAINTMPGLAYPLKVVQATEPGDGAIRIDVALQDKISTADFFIGDLTPVYAYGDRLRVNENVLVEVGFALASKEPNQIILLAMKRTDIPGDASNAKPTFDISHVRRHEFSNKDELKRKLRTELEASLKARGWLR